MHANHSGYRHCLVNIVSKKKHTVIGFSYLHSLNTAQLTFVVGMHVDGVHNNLYVICV